MILVFSQLSLPADSSADKLTRLSVVTLAFFAAIQFWQHLFLTSQFRGSLTALFFAVTWAGPPLAKMLIDPLTDARLNPFSRLIFPIDACSPPVAIYDLWRKPGMPIHLEILFQVMLAVILGLLASAKCLHDRQKASD